MAAGDILSLQTSIAPRLVRILYGVALALIVLGTIAGVTRGVLRMTHAPMQRGLMIDARNGAKPGAQAAANGAPAGPSNAQAAADAPPSADAPAAAPGDGRMMGSMGMGPRGFGMHRGMGGPGMGMRRMGMMHRGMMRGRHGMRGGPNLLGRQPAVLGGFQILRSLIAGFIGILLARILAELAGSVLAMGAKAREA